MNTNAAFAIFMVFVGCCSTVVFLELIVKEAPDAGNIITCCQFIFIALHGFFITMNFGKAKNKIPAKDYLVLVVFFFVVNVTNNVVFGFKISMPLHIIFRSGGLVASMVMGMIVLGRRYSLQKYISVLMITFGTISCTLASSQDIKKSPNDVEDESFTMWIIGITLLTIALLLSARMGIFQEMLYAKHGKHPKEALFFIHALSLPGFLFAGKNIYEHIIKFNASSPLPELAFLPIISCVPRLWVYTLGNTLCQFICISSVFKLTSECSALTVTMVLTLRKFMSLIFSIIYFKNSFSLAHWFGAILVFGGSLLFSDILPRPKLFATKEKAKSQ